MSNPSIRADRLPLGSHCEQLSTFAAAAIGIQNLNIEIGDYRRV
jgi:hypothetical protein